MAASNTDLIEDSGWDDAVLRGSERMLNQAHVVNQRAELLNAYPLPPLAQVVLALRLPAATFSGEKEGSDVRNAIIGAAIRHAQEGRSTRPLLLQDYVWQPAALTPTAELNDAFEVLVRERLDAVLPKASIPATRRRRIGFLLFHPLQNIAQHATVGFARAKEPFAGFSFRIVNEPLPITPSIRTYLDYLSATTARPERFLEIVIHDDGEGISGHFARYRMFQSNGIRDFDVYQLESTREWLFLKQAFERHTSSKYFRSVVDQDPNDTAFRPGIGLAAMMAAVRALDVYMEVRTGRFRAHRWFRADERVNRENLIHPDLPPRAGAAIRGTIFRMLVPISSSH